MKTPSEWRISFLQIMKNSSMRSHLRVGDVQGRDSLHVELHGVLLSNLLSLIGSIEVLTSDAALASGHVPPDDEVSAACEQSDSQPMIKPVQPMAGADAFPHATTPQCCRKCQRSCSGLSTTCA